MAKRRVIGRLRILLLAIVLLSGCLSNDATPVDESTTSMPDSTEEPAQSGLDSVLIVSNDYEPFTSTAQEGSGFILDVTRQAFDAVDVEVQYEFYPWKRCELYLEEGRAFAAAPYVKNEERLQKYNYSDPIILTSNKFFYNKEKFPEGFTWETLEDFQGYTMGGSLGYWYLPAFERAGLTVELVGTDKQNLAKLLDQRIDFLLLNELTGMHVLRANYPDDVDKIGMLDKPESVSEFYLMISRTYTNSEELTEKFNQGLGLIRGSDQYQQLLEQYLIPSEYALP